MTIKKAREIMTRTFKDDPDFRRSYVDNVACLLMDNMSSLKWNKPKRDVLADKIIHVIFET